MQFLRIPGDIHWLVLVFTEGIARGEYQHQEVNVTGIHKNCIVWRFYSLGLVFTEYLVNI